MNDDCLESCPSGYFDFQDYICKPYISKSNLFIDDLNQDQIRYEYIKDIWSNNFYQKSTYEGDQNIKGPFRFNDKIKYSFQKSQINSILEIEIMFYFYGEINDLSGLLFQVNKYQIGGVDSKLATSEIYSRSGVFKQIIECYYVGFSKCKKIQYYTTLQSFLEYDIVLEIGSFLNISDPFQAWGIDKVIVNEVEPATISPQVCSLWYEGNCIDKCPSYSTLNGITCEDYGSIFKNPKYILKELYPNHILTDFAMGLMNITTPEYQQFENRLLFFFNTNNQGGILWQKFKITVPHRKLRLMISILLIDWENNSQDYFLELVIGSNLNQNRHKFFADSFNQFIDYQINQEFPDYIYRNYTIDLNHNSKIFNLELHCFSPSNGYCSLFDYFIIVEQCDHGCSVCNQNGECMKYNREFENQISYYFQNYQCLDEYYYSNEQCIPCQFGCGKCNQNRCFKCKNGFEIKEGKCHCPISSTDGICLKPEYCPQQCQTCQKYKSFCDSCDIKQMKILNIYQCVCIKGYYLNSNLDCTQCDKKCTTCNDFESCTSCSDQTNRQLISSMCICKQGYYETAGNLICQQCHYLCKQCFFTYDYCSECDTQLFRQLSKGKCVCQIGYYEDNTQLCQKCNSNCYTCKQENNCLSCDLQLNRVLNTKYLCECNQGYFENEFKLCQKCHHSCLYCNQSEESNQCISCPSSRIKSYDKIDQFECKCRKGYFDIGVLQCMSCKQYPNALTSHPCYSFCGDKIIHWNEECDDGNNDSKDGCIDCFFSTEKCSTKICKKCYQGNCQICNDGYYLNKNNECQECSQSCITCITSSNNCLQCKFQLADQTCKMCDQKLGLQIINNTCQPICGDNIMIDNEQCDDGNLIDGDGQQGFICNPICQIINSINFILTSDLQDKYFQSKRYCYLDFNQDVIIDGNLSSMIKLQLNNSTIKFNYVMTNLSLQSLSIEIDFLESIENPIFQIEIMSPYKISNKQGVILIENIESIQLLSYSLQSESTQTATSSSSNFAYFIIIFLLSLAGFSFITGGLNIFFNLLDSIQLLAYLKYFNIVLPYNLQIYFQTFGFAEFDFLKEYISIQLTILDFDFKISEHQPDSKFAEQGYSALFIINILSVLFVFMITFCTCFLSQLVHKLCNYYINYLQNLIQKDNFYILNIFEYYLYNLAKHIRSLTNIYNIQQQNNIVRTFMSVAMDFNMAIFLQLKMYTQDLQFSYYLSIFALIAQLQFIYYGLNAISKKKYEFVTQTYKQKYESFLEGNPDIHQNQFVRYYNILILMKKMIFMFALIFFYNNACYQISISSILNIIFIVYIILIRPLKDIDEFYKVILTECILWFEQLMILIIYYIQSGDNLLDQSQIERMQILGWVIIALSVFMLLIQFLIDIKQHAYFLYQQYEFIQKMFKFVGRIFHKKDELTDQIGEGLIKDEKIVKSKGKIISYELRVERKLY
ncbi:unnamed protein product [Paramecium sonneborni]|uniref:EGF-like domain-containing protein n=1 Tax=Paramecium sonneborni TaxID=65129 RepID=A0A8S1LB92_9CILI|nr:unnamed protein product [Paramecium sonneborni]